LHFALSLQPKEKRRLEIQYQIEYPPTLIVEMRRKNDDREGAPAVAEPSSPFMPSPRRAYDLKRDIEKLEDAF
jgi:hypothetical protein